MWYVVPANDVAPNTQYVPDFSAGTFKTNAAGEAFQDRTFPYSGTYFEWDTFGAGVDSVYLKVHGPGWFHVSAWWSLRNLLNVFTPTNAFTVSLRVGSPTFYVPESDDADDEQPVPLAIAVNPYPTPDIIFDPTTDLEKTFSPTTLTTSVSTPYHIKTDVYFGLRSSGAEQLLHLDFTHSLKNNAGTLITPTFQTDAGIFVVRLGDFE